MNKNVWRLAGTILAFDVLFAIAFLFPMLLRTFIPGPVVPMATVFLAFLLMLISSIGVLLMKRWAVITLWVSLVLSTVFSVLMMGYAYPATISGGFLTWSIDLIIAIFLTIEWKRARVM